MSTIVETEQPDLADQARAAASMKQSGGQPQSSPFLDRIQQQLAGNTEPEEEPEAPEPKAEPQKEPETPEPEEEPESEEPEEPKEDKRTALEKAAAGEATEEEPEPDEPKLDAKAGAAFKKLKTQIKEYKAQMAKLQADSGSKEQQLTQISTTLAQALGVKDITPEAIERRAKELSAKAAVVDLESTPEYQKSVVEPEKTVRNSLKRVIDAYELDDQALQEALRETDRRKQTEMIEELVGDMPQRDQRVVWSSLDDLSLIEAKRAELRTQANEALEQIRQEQQQQAQVMSAQRAREIVQHTRTFAESLKRDFPGLAESVENQVDVVVQELQQGVNTQVQAYTALAGLMLPTLKGELSKRDKQIAELTKTVESYKKSTPGARPGNARDAKPEAAEENLTFMERLERQLSGR